MPETPAAIPNTLAAVRDHTRVYKDFTYVYPVISRRSGGLSIGINLNPDKVCNFDCVYCEVDRKTPGKTSFVDLAQLREELTALIHFARDGGLAREAKFDEVPLALTQTPRDIAFSGDGEPTMLHNFDECVRVAAEVKRAEGLDATKLVLITDAAGLDTGSVKRGLEIMDANDGEVWAKLDAGTEGYYKLVNRTTVRLDRILHNLLVTARARGPSSSRASSCGCTASRCRRRNWPSIVSTWRNSSTTARKSGKSTSTPSPAPRPSRSAAS